ADWFEKNPGLKGNDAKLREYMKNPGWKNGPAILTRCPTYDSNGWLPAISHGWYATMQEYDGGNKTPFAWEPGYSTGYQVNIQLRKGERLVRNWSNKGLHVNMPAGGPGCMTLKTGEVFLRYTPATGDLAPGRVGNGTLEYDVPLADGTFRSGALTAENLATTADDKQSPAVHVKDAAKDAILEIRMPSSYVYLTGAVNLKAAVGAGGSIAIAYSDSNGNTWKDVKTLAENGEQKVDLTPLCFRRYDYRLRFTLKGAGTGLDALKISHDIQHSQRPLPALGQGENKISFSSGAQEGTITIEPALLTEYQDKQVLFSDFKPDLKNVKSQGGLALTAPTGDATFKIATPGEMTRIRMNAYYRSRHVADVWEFQVSFDGGKTFKTIGKTDGPGWGPAQNAVANASTGQNVVANANTAEVPAGTKEALVRFAGSQNTVAMLFSLRIDADYKEPKGGFAPVKVTYQWEENGAAKQDVKVLTKPEESYTINCDAKPVMKSITLERAD
ncbi:MAG TPA: hypothetical protein VEJ63_09885, partial [Planctomycetota bacterium]|nr:hypothetical protein [Planctomycetota bacterium]